MGKRRTIAMERQTVHSEQERLLRRVKAQNPELAAELSNLALDWYRISPVTNEAEDTTEIFIYESIGGFFGIWADEFVKELNGIKSKNITVRINSPGGALFDAIAIYNALVQHPANVTTYVDSLAASAASIIAMAGDNVVMMVGSQMMIHDALGIGIGNSAEMREYAEFLDQQSDNIATMYADKAGGDPEEWREKMRAETWMFAQEAVELGLADEVFKRPAKKDEEESEEDESTDETESEEDESTDDDESVSEGDIEEMLSKVHVLNGRGFKYPGRKKAPDPGIVSDSEVDNFIAAMSKVIGGR